MLLFWLGFFYLFLFVVRFFVAFFSFYVGFVVVVFLLLFFCLFWGFLVCFFLTSGFLRMLSMYLIISFYPLCQVFFFYFPAEWYILRYTRTDLQVNFEVLAACLQWSSARHRFSRQFYNRGLLPDTRT